ncbi:MAG: Txe/YoeB family addiction module toxin [Methylophilaceae bacterium]|nr:Txe/YoeB family addiction module toxin [Methylophilaceae bacterium]
MARLLTFTPAAWGDYLYWQGQDKKTLKRINSLINEAARSPFDGIGKPEGLRGDLSGAWSRRIDDVNRLVYEVTESELLIIACRFHYES